MSIWLIEQSVDRTKKCNSHAKCQFQFSAQFLDADEQPLESKTVLITINLI